MKETNYNLLIWLDVRKNNTIYVKPKGEGLCIGRDHPWQNFSVNHHKGFYIRMDRKFNKAIIRNETAMMIPTNRDALICAYGFPGF